MASQHNDDLFLIVLNRWRSLGGSIAIDDDARDKSVVEEGDETGLRNGDWIYLIAGDGTLDQVKRLDCTRGCVLDATFGQPGREGIESWGDWEISVDRVEKSESCRDLVDLTMVQIGAGCEDEGSQETMLNASAFMRRMEPGWDEVLDKMGENLTPDLFGAENTEVKACVKYEDDGNEFIALVDVGECMYVCAFLTS